MHGTTSAGATTSTSSSSMTPYDNNTTNDAIPMELDPLYEKADGLWFEDGNLILQAEHTLFRIYRGLLCARSSVFGDMFAFPPPAEGNHSSLDGCPIVPTYDSAHDLTVFLKALLDSSYFQPPPTPTTMPILEGVLRLSTKYDVKSLRLRAMDHLSTTYPTTLAGWKGRDHLRTIPSVENTPFVVLNLAREFDMPWLVPSVAYCICSHDIKKTLLGAEWSEYTGTRTRGTDGGEAQLHGQVEADDTTTPTSRRHVGGPVKLTWADQQMCIIGRQNILLKQNAQALAIARGPIRRSSQQQQQQQQQQVTPVPAPAALPVNQNLQQQQLQLLQAQLAQQQVAGIPNAAAVGLVGGATTPNGGLANPLNNNQNNGPAVIIPAPVPAPAVNGAQPVPVAVPHPPTTPSPPPLASCPTPSVCSQTRFRCAAILTSWGTAGYLDFFDEQRTAFEDGMCSGCLEDMRIVCERGGELMWEKLAEVFFGQSVSGAAGQGAGVRWEDLEEERRKVYEGLGGQAVGV